jgi:hypothetical protein
MYVRVIQCFACGPKVYRPGEYEVTPALAVDLDQLVRLGWVVVIRDDPSPLQLQTPESGQHMTFR